MTGKTVAEVAQDLGINETTLASWVSRARRAGTAPSGAGDDLERLRRENAQLKQDNKELSVRVRQARPEGVREEPAVRAP
ncbi:transposase [Streptomyces avermitilis]|uniref:transposase n=1 Tax=Streptomyces avermitilis TaxID=33903 RepID=UPI003824B8F5